MLARNNPWVHSCCGLCQSGNFLIWMYFTTSQCALLKFCHSFIHLFFSQPVSHNKYINTFIHSSYWMIYSLIYSLIYLISNCPLIHSFTCFTSLHVNMGSKIDPSPQFFFKDLFQTPNPYLPCQYLVARQVYTESLRSWRKQIFLLEIICQISM